jgi:hypothetical protein
MGKNLPHPHLFRLRLPNLSPMTVIDLHELSAVP